MRLFSVIANVLKSGLEVNEVKLQSRYCIHFGINSLRKGMTLLIPSAMNRIVSLQFYVDALILKYTVQFIYL